MQPSNTRRDLLKGGEYHADRAEIGKTLSLLAGFISYFICHILYQDRRRRDEERGALELELFCRNDGIAQRVERIILIGFRQLCR